MNAGVSQSPALTKFAFVFLLLFGASDAFAFGSPVEKLTSPNSAAYVNFGWSVSLDGLDAIVSANHNDYPGHVAVYHDSGDGHWLSTAILSPSDSHRADEFGWSTALDDSTALIGAPRYGDDGAAYVFEMDHEGRWQQSAQLKPTGAIAPNDFGYSVSLSGSTALVGAYSEAIFHGAAYVFEKNQHGGWSQIERLQPIGAVGAPEFGTSVSVSGSVAIIGAATDNFLTGAAYIFGKDANGRWNQQARLTPEQTQGKTGFGSRVSVDGKTAIVSAPGAGEQTGAALIFREDEFGNWNEIAKLTAKDPLIGPQFFGSTVSISGSRALVGAFNFSDAGAAYVFEEDEFGIWNQIAVLHGTESSRGGSFGYSVDLDGSHALVGDVIGDQFLGAAYLFKIPEPNTEVLVLGAILWAKLTATKKRRRPLRETSK